MRNVFCATVLNKVKWVLKLSKNGIHTYTQKHNHLNKKVVNNLISKYNDVGTKTRSDSTRNWISQIVRLTVETPWRLLGQYRFKIPFW